MARRKKKSGRRRPPRVAGSKAPQRAAEPPEPRPADAPVDPLAARLGALRARLLKGDVDGALAAVDAWLAELIPPAPAESPPEAASEPAPAPAPAPADPIAAGLLQPLDAPGPRFSVLMAAYNRAHLIGEAIESVLVQGFADWELVIVDDGSTDATPEVVGRFAAAEPRIRYVRKPRNEGRSPTRSRAVAEARGEYVLWMADDDLLAPDLLATYDAALRETPHVDVIYGKLQLFEGDRDLDVYTPNDWTGRERRLLGAELHGSCVPDGGTATRRALYAQVGAPIYDPEFTRAQDYELWTRLLPHARVRMLDRVVYRYRKHDGGTSWGPFVDLSYDSKIIRRHLSRHPLEDLFVGLDWTDPPGARRAAMAQVGRLMLEYQDPHNAERFLAAAAASGVDPDLVEQRVRGRLMAGDRAGAARIVDGFVADWPGHHPLAARLRAQIDATAELDRVGRAAIAAGRPSEAEKRAVAHHNRYGLGHDVCRLRAGARLAGGDRREALWFLCQAARMAVGDAESAAQARALAEELGVEGPKADIEAMRRRLTEVFVEPTADPCPGAGPTSISAVIVARGGDVRRAVQSALDQTRAPREILLVGAESPDPRALTVAADGDLRAAGLAAATGDAVAWLTTDAAWTPQHLARLGAALDGGAQAAWGDGHRLDPETGETTCRPPAGVDRARLLADDRVPLCALMHRRGRAPDPVEGPYADWIYALDLVWGLDREADLVRVGAPTWVGPPPAEGPAPGDAEGRRALERVFARHPTPLLFAPAARARQAERLRPLGVDWPLRGRTGVVIVGGDDPAAFAETLGAVEAGTRCPHAVVVVADGPSPATRAALIARCAGHTLVTTPRRLGPAKAFNLGLARAGGDRVAILRAGVTPADGWLGRMRWWLAEGPEALALALPAGADGPEARVERPDDRALLVTRAALDAVGGADLALDPTLALDDWLLRLRRAGFGWRATDVAFEGLPQRYATPADPGAAPRFRARWGALPVGDRLPDLPPPTGAPLYQPYGAEEGDRFDVPPVAVHDGEGGSRVLIRPPWRDADARRALLDALAPLPSSIRVWVRVAPGEGPAARDAFAAGPALDAPLWIIDAPLAPDREGGLIVAADAVYVDDRWPGAADRVRRAFDCGRPPLRTPAALRRWAEARGPT